MTILAGKLSGVAPPPESRRWWRDDKHVPRRLRDAIPGDYLIAWPADTGEVGTEEDLPVAVRVSWHWPHGDAVSVVLYDVKISLLVPGWRRRHLRRNDTLPGACPVTPIALMSLPRK